MEVQRSFPPQPGFLQAVRNLCTEKGIVLIFDECTSGFRESYGGLHLKYGIEPDLAMFGKALGNGFAVTAVIGRASVMQSAQSTFISSTFWTERIGSVAALRTLQLMDSLCSWDHISQIGSSFRKRLLSLSLKYDLPISLQGIPALTTFTFDRLHIHLKTLLTQEMLKRGYLSSTIFYPSTSHTELELDEFFWHLDPVFEKLASSQDEAHIISQLDAPLCHTGFARLN